MWIEVFLLYLGKIKKFIAIIIFFSIISLQMYVFADDDFDEEFDFNMLDELLQDVRSRC